jgi:hypothetical protein
LVERSTIISLIVLQFPKQTKWRKGILNTKLCEIKFQWRKLNKAPNFALTKELNENTNKSTTFWLNVWQGI